MEVQAMIGAMKVPEDQPAAGGRPAIPAKTERLDKFCHYLGGEGQKCIKGLDDNVIEAKNFTAAHTAQTTCFSKTANKIYQFHVLHSMRQGDNSMDKSYKIDIIDTVKAICQCISISAH